MNDLIKIILELDCSDPKKVFGSPDDLKLKSSMTLFYLATKDKRFILVLNKFYNGEFDENTIDIIIPRIALKFCFAASDSLSHCNLGLM